MVTEDDGCHYIICTSSGHFLLFHREGADSVPPDYIYICPVCNSRGVASMEGPSTDSRMAVRRLEPVVHHSDSERVDA